MEFSDVVGKAMRVPDKIRKTSDQSAGWTLTPRKDFCSLSRTKDICGTSAVLGQLIYRTPTAVSCDATD
jgi:hypothetical protein